MLTGLRHPNSYTQFVAPMNGDKTVKSAIDERNKFLKFRVSDTDTHSREQYKRQRNIVTKLIKLVKREAHVQELGDNLRSKRRVIRELFFPKMYENTRPFQKETNFNRV